MGAAIGDILPLALGVAISPVPIIAVILMLLSKNAGGTSIGYMIGWLIGIVGAFSLFTWIASVSSITAGSDSSWVGALIKLLLGLLSIGLAVKQWRSRPKPGETPPTPKLLSAIEKMKPGAALATGVALSVANPKNLIMIVSAGIAVGGYGLSVGNDVVVGLVFTLIAASTVVGPVLVYFLMKDKATVWLNELKAWLTANNATVMAVLFLVIGTVLVGKGIGGF